MRGRYRDRQAKHVGRPRPRPIVGKIVVVRVGTRSKSTRPRECCGNVAFAGPGEEDIRVRAGKRAEPGWLAKPAKRTEPNISRANLVPRIQVVETESGRKPGYSGGSRPCSRSKTNGPTRTDAQGRTNVSLARRQAEPTVGRREAEGRGRHLRVTALFRSGSKVDAASIPDSRNVASADVVGTGREVGESRTEACRAACRVACGRAERTGGTVHWENTSACTCGEIGRGGTRIRAGAPKGIVERQVGQQWLAGRETRAGSVAMMQFER